MIALYLSINLLKFEHVACYMFANQQVVESTVRIEHPE